MTLAAYVKGGYFLRTASKAYQKVHEIVEKNGKVSTFSFPLSLSFLPFPPPPSLSPFFSDFQLDYAASKFAVDSSLVAVVLTFFFQPVLFLFCNECKLSFFQSDPDGYADVRAAYSLGFGIVNVALSLLPETVLSVMKLIGFGGNRDVGRQALELVSESDDMKSPIAM